MKFCSFVFLVTLLFTLNVKSQIKSSDSDNQKITTNSRKAYVEGEVILKFKSSGTSLQCGKSTDKLKVNDKDINMLSDKFGVYELKELHKKSSQPVKSYAKKDETGTSETVLLRFDKQFNPEKVAEEFEELENVEYAEPNYLYYGFEFISNDESEDELWYLDQIGAYQAWEIQQGDTSVTIGIMDTGVDWDHQDLESNIWVNPGEDINLNGKADESDINGIDDDGNGYIDDIRGWDFVDNAAGELPEGEDGFDPDNDPDDFYGHGTAVAGIVSAISDNNIGVDGIAPKCRIVPLRVGYASSESFFAAGTIAEALYYAADNHVDFVNMSFGSDPYSEVVAEAVENAYAAGVIMFAAVGNEDSEIKHYPAGYQDVIAVAGTNYNAKKAAVSNFGSWVDISAPVLDIVTTSPGNGYRYFSGTSAASPLAAGVAALIKSEHPEWSSEEIISCLFASAKRIDKQNPNFAGKIGIGMIDAGKAMEEHILQHTIVLYDRSLNKYYNRNNESLLDSLGFAIKIKNYGLQAENVYIKLLTDNSYVTIGTDSVFIGSMAFRDTAVANQDCIIRINPGVPQGETAIITCEVHSANADVYSENFEIVLHEGFKNREGFPVVIDGYVKIIKTADVDNDGKNEIVCQVEDYGFRIINERGKIRHSIAFRDDYSEIPRFTLADVDNDSNVDILYQVIENGPWGGESIHRVFARNYKGENIEGWPVKNTFVNESGIIYDDSEIIADDIDGDRNIEILVESCYDKQIFIYNSDGTPYSTWMPGTSFKKSPSAIIRIADLDNDNDKELVIVDSAEIKIYHHDGSPMIHDQILAGGSISNPVLKDINSDNELEIIAVANNDSLYIWNAGGELLYNWPYHHGCGFIITKKSDNVTELVLIGADYITAYEVNGTKIWEIKEVGTMKSDPLITDVYDNSSSDILIAMCEGDLRPSTPNSAFTNLWLLNNEGENRSEWPMQIKGTLETNKLLCADDLDKNGTQEIILCTNIPKRAYVGAYLHKSYINVLHNSSDILPSEIKEYQKNIREENRRSSSFHLYPNPAKDAVTIEAEEYGQVQLIELIDVNGHVVSAVNPATHNGSITIPLDGIQEGIYYVRIIAGDQIMSEKLVLTR